MVKKSGNVFSFWSWLESIVIAMKDNNKKLLKLIIKETLTETLQSKNIDIESEDSNGSLSANVHYNMNRLMNWAEKEKLSTDTKEKLSKLPLPVAILKNVWVDEEARGQGIGSELMSKFLMKRKLLLVSY